METWFTSDLHFEHHNIIEYCGRPFEDVTDMRYSLIRNWNRHVDRDDVVYILGDFAMGRIADSLPIARMLNGRKRLILGNHDRPFPTNKQSQRWFDEYARYFEDIRIHDTLEVDGTILELNHFPYQGDSHDSDRFEAFRPADNGNWLLHGHVHWTGRRSGARMVHIGTDAWGYRPANLTEVMEIIREADSNVPV